MDSSSSSTEIFFNNSFENFQMSDNIEQPNVSFTLDLVRNNSVSFDISEDKESDDEENNDNSLITKRKKIIQSNEKEKSLSDSPQTIEYNIFLNNKGNAYESLPTPTVSEVVLFKYNLSPEIINEKTNDEYNFVFPLPEQKSIVKNENNDNVNNKDKLHISLKYYLSTICTIGKGSFGRVYLARHRETGHYYALKAMNISTVIAKRQVEHVYYEKQILQQLNHPFIVKLYDTAKDRKNLYMIFEYLPGGELFSYLRIKKKFASYAVKFYAAEIISAFEYLHSMYIAYRDLKPENFMLMETGHVKLTDFGFAKKIYNKSYTFCGTTEYLAPEIITRAGHNHMVDYWSLGILIFELMAGYTPFKGKTCNDILESIQSQNTINFPQKTFSPRAKDLITQLLKANPNERLGKKSIEEIKQHEWFENCNWEAIYKKEIPAPLIPKIYYDGDTGNFDTFDEFEEIRIAQQRELDLFNEW